MKPRLLICSAGESLDIGHAVQQNLRHESEVTVWNQGMVKLSVTVLESLQFELDSCDFAIFIFSPDDVAQIRGDSQSIVRDNVIFELGLFMGAIGRERCFILTPETAKDLRIPSDLAGIISAHYEDDRSDNNVQAGTASACTQILHAIRRLGLRQGRKPPLDIGAGARSGEREDKSDDSFKKPASKKLGEDWLIAFIENDYAKAEKLLQKELGNTSSSEVKIDLGSWLGRVLFQTRPKDGVAQLEEVIAEFPKGSTPYIHLGYALVERGDLEASIRAFSRGINVVDQPFPLIVGAAESHCRLGEYELAIDLIKSAIVDFPNISGLFSELALVYTEKGDENLAESILEEGLRQHPSDKELLEKYARLLADRPHKKMALLPFAKLISLVPNSPDFLASRGNLLLSLGFNNLAMKDYLEANENAEEKQGWILANIGNLFNNRGLHCEGIKYLEKAIELEPESEYAHKRLAAAIKMRGEEREKYNALIKEIELEFYQARQKSQENEG
jgi:tetratricopeptide (TPR) repeat protein